MLDNKGQYDTVKAACNAQTVEEPSLEFYIDRKDFPTLETWIKCREIKNFFYKKVLPLLPKEEKYNLDIQIRKASVSSTANIAEGYGCYHYQEGISFIEFQEDRCSN